MRAEHFLPVFLLVLIAGSAWIYPVNQPPRAVAFELARTVAQAEKILGPFGGRGWVNMRETFLRDGLFILGYVGFFLMAGLAVGASSARLGWFVVLAALAVGALDVMENTFALRFLAVPPSESDREALLASMSMWSRLKWWGLGPLSLALAWGDWWHFQGALKWIAGGAFLLTGLAFVASAAVPAVLRFGGLMPLLAIAMLTHTIAALRR